MTAILGLIFIGVQVVDSFLTLWAVHNGYTEINPLITRIAGSWLLPAVKIIPALIVAWALTRIVDKWPSLHWVANTGLIVVIAFISLVIISNLFEIKGGPQ